MEVELFPSVCSAKANERYPFTPLPYYDTILPRNTTDSFDPRKPPVGAVKREVGGEGMFEFCGQLDRAVEGRRENAGVRLSITESSFEFWGSQGSNVFTEYAPLRRSRSFFKADTILTSTSLWQQFFEPPGRYIAERSHQSDGANLFVWGDTTMRGGSLSVSEEMQAQFTRWSFDSNDKINSYVNIGGSLYVSGHMRSNGLQLHVYRHLIIDNYGLTLIRKTMGDTISIIEFVPAQNIFTNSVLDVVGNWYFGAGLTVLPAGFTNFYTSDSGNRIVVVESSQIVIRGDEGVVGTYAPWFGLERFIYIELVDSMLSVVYGPLVWDFDMAVIRSDLEVGGDLSLGGALVIDASHLHIVGELRMNAHLPYSGITVGRSEVPDRRVAPVWTASEECSRGSSVTLDGAVKGEFVFSVHCDSCVTVKEGIYVDVIRVNSGQLSVIGDAKVSNFITGTEKGRLYVEGDIHTRKITVLKNAIVLATGKIESSHQVDEQLGGHVKSYANANYYAAGYPGLLSALDCPYVSEVTTAHSASGFTSPTEGCLGPVASQLFERYGEPVVAGHYTPKRTEW
eukprot:GHVN01080799.1.p1 GENE.GHVN01080799.1~~GHVN01080799.1.p1  ORF type:complete len:567 (+),score=103.15 GHVN01080799.1:518-2218(+)